jgi:hypothetical protein
MIAHNKLLAEAAQMAGVVDPRDYEIFQCKGYHELYGGFGAKEWRSQDDIPPSLIPVQCPFSDHFFNHKRFIKRIGSSVVCVGNKN